MKELALQLAAGQADPARRMNLLREYIQSCALRSLHESNAFQSLSFVGGTALRFLYDLPRFSEDLDFSLESPNDYDPERWMSKLKRDLFFQGFEASLTWNNRKTVHIAWIRIAGILQEAGIVARKQQNLSIKLEIDTRPPSGALIETHIINKYGLLALRHHDITSLMAGKVHALCTRPYEKGRDWYDLIWYRSRRPRIDPNPLLLKNAMEQTSTAYSGDWKSMIAARVHTADFDHIRADVGPFLERREDVRLLERNLVLSCLADE